MANAFAAARDPDDRGRPANALVALRRRQAAQRVSDPPRMSWADAGELAAEATPYGNYIAAQDAVEDFKAGYLGSGSLNALMALPGLGIVGAVGRKAKGAGKRLARAAEQGYLLDEPMYHGSNALFDVFDSSKRGVHTGRMSGKAADWATFKEDAARDFADLSVERSGGKPVVRKLVAHKDGFEVLNLKGQDLSDADMMNHLLDRKDAGVRVVKIEGVNDSIGNAHPGPVYAILDQGAVRDVDRARFDPAELGRPGLTKALAGLGVSIPFVRSFQSEPKEGEI